MFCPPAGLSENGLVITQGGKLLCRKIIHLINGSNVKSQVSVVLEECERRKYKSVAFPAIGTGLCFLGKAMRAVTEVVQKLGQG